MPAGASGVVVASFHQPVVSGFATAIVNHRRRESVAA